MAMRRQVDREDIRGGMWMGERCGNQWDRQQLAAAGWQRRGAPARAAAPRGHAAAAPCLPAWRHRGAPARARLPLPICLHLSICVCLPNAEQSFSWTTDRFFQNQLRLTRSKPLASCRSPSLEGRAALVGEASPHSSGTSSSESHSVCAASGGASNRSW